METGTASAIAVLLMAGLSMKSHIISIRLITLSACCRAGFLSIIALPHNVAIYIYSLRHFTGKRYFAASIAGAIIGVVLFVFVSLLLFFRFEFPRDLSI